MTTETPLDLLSFFKALADPGRLRVAGLLAGGDQSLRALAAALGERPDRVRRHLDYLGHAGLVGGPSGPAETYRLRLDAIHALAGQTLARPATVVPAEASQDEFERKVLKDHLRPDLSIHTLPAQDRQFDVIVRFVHGQRPFEPGQRYTEKEVNARLARYHPDTAILRRALVDRGLLLREANGRSYWVS